MDASDTIRKRKAAAIYAQKKAALAAAQPAADCGKTECTPFSTCIITYTNYDEKQLFKEGRNNCNTCACAQ
jgi:hypothetical protein